MRELSAEALHLMRERLPQVADDVVEAIVAEVPSYEGAFAGEMGQRIRQAVQLALGGFLVLAGRSRSAGGEDLLAVFGTDPAGSPRQPAVSGAYQLGRGEARSGRSTEALLAAYRIGARVAWRDLSATAVQIGVTSDELARFAELVFAYIDELSAASVAGHADESENAGRAQQRLLERLVRRLLEGAPSDVLGQAAERADWRIPQSLTAVVLPMSQMRSVLASLPSNTLQSGEVDLGDLTLLLVPDLHGRRRPALLQALNGHQAVIGPSRGWLDAAASFRRVQRALELGLTGDTEEHLTELVLTADPEALSDLTSLVLQPLDDFRQSSKEKLVETLRAWLLHQGRRDDIATALFVHPQTVRYRMGQLRAAFGDRLEDPATVLGLTIALGVNSVIPRTAGPRGPRP